MRLKQDDDDDDGVIVQSRATTAVQQVGEALQVYRRGATGRRGTTDRRGASYSQPSRMRRRVAS